MTDAVTRSSITMAKCSTAFNASKFDNFKKFGKNWKLNDFE